MLILGRFGIRVAIAKSGLWQVGKKIHLFSLCIGGEDDIKTLSLILLPISIIIGVVKKIKK